MRLRSGSDHGCGVRRAGSAMPWAFALPCGCFSVSCLPASCGALCAPPALGLSWRLPGLTVLFVLLIPVLTSLRRSRLPVWACASSCAWFNVRRALGGVSVANWPSFIVSRAVRGFRLVLALSSFLRRTLGVSAAVSACACAVACVVLAVDSRTSSGADGVVFRPSSPLSAVLVRCCLVRRSCRSDPVPSTAVGACARTGSCVAFGAALCICTGSRSRSVPYSSGS